MLSGNLPVSDSSNNEFNSSPEDLQRFIELGRLSASLLHEISSPLSAALLSLEQVRDQKSLHTLALKRSLVRLKRYVNAARQQLIRQSCQADFYIDDQLRDIKRLVLPLAKTSRVRLLIKRLPHTRLRGDPIKFQQLLVNLIVNAIEAYPADYKLRPRIVDVTTRLSPKSIAIEVTDWGMGISKAQLPKLFEPFYTTKTTAGHGLGLGLFIVKQYVTDSFGGSIKVSSSMAGGTRFIVKLPL
jgi:signal transduction histidine kinase